MLMFIQHLHDIVIDSAARSVKIPNSFGGFPPDCLEVPDNDGFVLGGRGKVVAVGLIDGDAADPLGVAVAKRK